MCGYLANRHPDAVLHVVRKRSQANPKIAERLDVPWRALEGLSLYINHTSFEIWLGGGFSLHLGVEQIDVLCGKQSNTFSFSLRFK